METLSIIEGGSATWGDGMSLIGFATQSGAANGDVYNFDTVTPHSFISTYTITANDATLNMTGATFTASGTGGSRFLVSSSTGVVFNGGTINLSGNAVSVSGIEWGVSLGVQTPTGTVNNVMVTGSGNQAFQHYANSVVTYNNCTGDNGVDDGMSLHDNSTVTSNGNTYTNNAEGINIIDTATYTGNGDIFGTGGNANTVDLYLSGTSGTDQTTFTLNDSTIPGAVVSHRNGQDAEVTATFNRCKFLGEGISPVANENLTPIVFGTGFGAGTGQQFDIVFNSCEIIVGSATPADDNILSIRPSIKKSTVEFNNCQVIGFSDGKNGPRIVGAMPAGSTTTIINMQHKDLTGTQGGWTTNNATNGISSLNSNFENCTDTFETTPEFGETETTTLTFDYVDAGNDDYNVLAADSPQMGIGSNTTLPLNDLNNTAFLDPPAIGAYTFIVATGSSTLMDCRYEVLSTAFGSVAAVPEMLLSYVQALIFDRHAVTPANQITDAWSQLFTLEGIPGARNDQEFGWLVAEGATGGSLSDLWLDYWCIVEAGSDFNSGFSQGFS